MRKKPLVAAVVGVVASAVDMRWSYLHHANVTRLYEGTDTRSQDILVGAVLAIGLTMWARHRRALPRPVPDLTELELARKVLAEVGADEPKSDEQTRRISVLVDIGPKAGTHGGEVVFEGSYADLRNRSSVY